MVVREPDRLFVNGVDLGKQWFLTVESTYQMPAQVRDGMVETPGRHGAHASGRPPVYDMGAGKLVLRVGKPERGHLREVLDEVIGLLTGGSEVVLMHASGGKARQAVIEVQSWSVTERVPQVFADLEVSYVVPGVFLRSLTTLERSLPAGTSTLPREGTAPVTDAIVRFAGPSSGAHTVTEGVWGTGVTWTGSLVSGQHVFIDPLAMRAWQGAEWEWTRQWRSLDASTGLAPATAGPLALHHTTGWGQGAVTRTNYAHDPFLQYTPFGARPSGMGVGAAEAKVVVNQVGEWWLEVASTYHTNAGYVAFNWTPLHVPNATVHLSAEVDVSEAAWAAGGPPALVVLYKPTEGAALVTQRAAAPGPGRHRLSLTVRIPSTATRLYYRLYRNAKQGDPPVFFRDITLSDTPGPVFSGDTRDTDELAYEWTGTPGKSASTVGPRVLTRSTPLTASKAATIRYWEAWL